MWKDVLISRIHKLPLSSVLICMPTNILCRQSSLHWSQIYISTTTVKNYPQGKFFGQAGPSGCRDKSLGLVGQVGGGGKGAKMLGANRVGTPKIGFSMQNLTQKKALSDVVALVGPVGPSFYTRGGRLAHSRRLREYAPSARMRENVRP